MGVLEDIRDLLPAEKAVWDSDRLMRLAVERLWITAGNLAEVYRILEGIPPGSEPWAELVSYRNVLAHALPGDISPNRVYADTGADVGRILTLLSSL